MNKLVAIDAGCAVQSSAAVAGPIEEVRGGVYAQGCCGFGSDKEQGVAFNGEAVIAGDVGYRLTDNLSASFHCNHISNAELCSDNEGLDQMGVRLGLSF